MRPSSTPLRGALAALLAAFLLTTGPALAAASATAPAGGCADDQGVTVVVDLTDEGGDVVVGCAEGDPTTGRDALESAGFTPTDDQPGFICAIDDVPDPCPTEFTGSYWSYWTAAPDGEWTAYTEGADTADPAPGTFEGWRYNDGATGPGVQPADVAAAAAGAAAESAEATADAEEQANEAGSDEANGPSAATLAGIAVLVLLIVGVIVVAARRRQA